MNLPIQAAPINVKAAKKDGQNGIEPSAYKGYCYFHHSCPADGFIGKMTKQQCRNYPRAHSWENSSGGCENFN